MYQNELSKNDVSIHSLTIFYYSINTLVYKDIGGVMHTIIDEYIFVYYLGLIQEKLSKHDNNFKNNNFKDLSGLVIPDIFMNVISCHLFVKSSISTLILKCCNDLVPYYTSKVFVIVEIEVGGVDNVTINVKNISMILIYMKRRVF